MNGPAPTFRPRPAARLLATLLCGLVGVVAARADGDPPLRRAPLDRDVAVEIRADGRLLVIANASDAVLLSADFPDRPGRRRAGDRPAPHAARSHEGAPGGRRGFSALADDDRDARLDEDPLDGRDNDGDGRVDEDYAAVGDEMYVVDRGPGRGRVEYYRWAHPHLRRTVFAAPVAGPEGLGPATWRLRSSGAAWIETEVRGLHHEVTGRAVVRRVTAWVSRAGAPADGPVRWLGVAVLDAPGPTGAGRAVLDGRELSVRLGDSPVPIALVTSATWLGLVRGLVDAAEVREGAVDPVTERRVPWVVPPRCTRCRDAARPDFRWHVDARGTLVVSARLEDGCGLRIDPDRFRIAGRALGAPDQIVHRGEDRAEQGVGWYAMAPERLARTGVGLADPYTAWGDGAAHGHACEVAYRFRSPSPALLRRLTGGQGARPASEIEIGLVGGPPVACQLRPDLQAAEPVRSAVAPALAADQASRLPATEQSRLLQSEQTRPTLAPELLHGWPNPFRDLINLRVRVPATVGEAFVWEGEQGPPAGVDASAAVPWAGGAPSVSVKIYSLSGRELRTLYEELNAGAEVVVQWDGTDALGRKVASGTYFCKLQLDDWSTTRRVVFMR